MKNPDLSWELEIKGTTKWEIVSKEQNENYQNYEVMEIISGDTISGYPPSYGFIKEFGPDTSFFKITQIDTNYYRISSNNVMFYPVIIKRYYEDTSDFLSYNSRDNSNCIYSDNSVASSIYTHFIKLKKDVGITDLYINKNNGNPWQYYRVILKDNIP